MFLLRRSRWEGSRRARPCFSSASATEVTKEGSQPILSPRSFIVIGRLELEQGHGIAAGQPEVGRDALAEVVGMPDELAERVLICWFSSSSSASRPSP